MSPVFNTKEKTLLIQGTFENISFETASTIRDLTLANGQTCIQIVNTNDYEDFEHRKKRVKRQLDNFGLTYQSKYIILSETDQLPELYEDTIRINEI